MKKYIIIFILIAAFAVCSLGLSWAEEEKITLAYEDNAQFELVSPEGIRVLFDVRYTDPLLSPPALKDIVLVTCGQANHSSPFVHEFAGQKMIMKAGEWEIAGIRITGIASSIYDVPNLPAKGDGTNYIYVVEMAGIKIVNLGDIGQTALTPGQLERIGSADIVLTPLSSPYNPESNRNFMAFQLMDQLQPKLVIPTHLNEETARYALKKWQGYYFNHSVKIGRSNLGGKIKFLMGGTNGLLYGKAMKLAPLWK